MFDNVRVSLCRLHLGHLGYSKFEQTAYKDLMGPNAH